MSVIPLRVLIVADDPLARGGLAAMFANRPDGVVVGQMAADADAISGVGVYRPDVVLWDLGWERSADAEQESPGTHLEHLAALQDTGVPVAVVLSDASHAVAAWDAGARCLLFRDVQVDPLVASLHAAVQGLVVLDGLLATSLLPMHQAEPAPLVDALTPREQDVLHLLAEGLPNKVIADRLHISEHTVKFHVNAVMGKLGAQSRTDAVVRATRRGWVLL